VGMDVGDSTANSELGYFLTYMPLMIGSDRQTDRRARSAEQSRAEQSRACSSATALFDTFESGALPPPTHLHVFGASLESCG
jgi:hypothetical protein